jgi:2'-5' RNA ligase
VKEKFSAFNIDISNIGVFGSSYAPKLIWLGVENEILKRLGNDVIAAMEKVGFIVDRQNFVPHITLGRIKKLEDKNYFQKIISANKEKYIQSIYVEKFHLIESILHKTGPVYKIIETYDFKKS